MKHLLNNLSEEEKNNIREQYTGRMKLAIDNFKKLVESKLGDAKPYLVEQGQSSQNKEPRFKVSTFNGDVEYFFDGIKDEDTHFKFVNPFNSQELFNWLVTPKDKGGAGLEDMKLDPKNQSQFYYLFGDGLEAVARTGVQGNYASDPKFLTQLGQITRGVAPGTHRDKKTYTLNDPYQGWKIIGGQQTFGRVLSLLVQKAKAMI